MPAKPVRTPLLTLPQVAERLAVSLDTARRLVRRAELPSVDVGAAGRPQYRVDSDVLEKWLRDRSS